MKGLIDSSVRALLYTSYLQILGSLYYPFSQSLTRAFPPPHVDCTFLAGFSAGAVQSIVAASLDALSVRFKTSDVLSGHYENMRQYSRSKMQDISPRGN